MTRAVDFSPGSSLKGTQHPSHRPLEEQHWLLFVIRKMSALISKDHLEVLIISALRAFKRQSELAFVLWRGNACLWRWRDDLHLGYRSRPSHRTTPAQNQKERDEALESDTCTCQQSSSVSSVFDVYADTHTHFCFWQKQYNFEAVRQTYSGETILLHSCIKQKTSTHTTHL